MSKDKTRAKVPPPRKSFLPSPPEAPVGAANNMKGDREVSMTFVMSRDWHTRFKITAATRNITMKELMIESFAAWEREQKLTNK